MDSLHLNVLHRGEDDSDGVKEEVQESVSHGHIAAALVLTNTTYIEAQVDLHGQAKVKKQHPGAFRPE